MLDDSASHLALVDVLDGNRLPELDDGLVYIETCFRAYHFAVDLIDLTALLPDFILVAGGLDQIELIGQNDQRDVFLPVLLDRLDPVRDALKALLVEEGVNNEEAIDVLVVLLLQLRVVLFLSGSIHEDEVDHIQAHVDLDFHSVQRVQIVYVLDFVTEQVLDDGALAHAVISQEAYLVGLRVIFLDRVQFCGGLDALLHYVIELLLILPRIIVDFRQGMVAFDEVEEFVRK